VCTCIGFTWVKVKYGFEEEGAGWVGGGSRYQTGIPMVRLSNFNFSMTRVLTILGGGNMKGT
jgi:hypothetical protein